MAKILETDMDTMKNWLILIEVNYHYRSPYHNATHAPSTWPSLPRIILIIVKKTLTPSPLARPRVLLDMIFTLFQTDEEDDDS